MFDIRGHWGFHTGETSERQDRLEKAMLQFLPLLLRQFTLGERFTNLKILVGKFPLN
jgi:hypothetical protein